MDPLLPPMYGNYMFPPFFQPPPRRRHRRRRRRIHFTNLKPLNMNRNFRPHLRVTKWRKRPSNNGDGDEDHFEENIDFIDAIKKKRGKFLKKSMHLGVEKEEKKIEEFVNIRKVFILFLIVTLLK